MRTEGERAVTTSTAHSLAATCTFGPTIDVSAGLSAFATTTNSIASEGAATLDCIGSVDGEAITGLGTIRSIGTVTGSCAYGAGSLTEYISRPTTAGTIELVSYATVSYVGTAGTLNGAYLSGSWTFAPLEGNCITTKVTRTITSHLTHGNVTLS